MNNKTQHTSGCPLFGWIQTANQLESRVEDDLGAIGLSLARYGVLEQLASAPDPLSLGELAERLSCVRSNITQLVDRLEAEGLVRRAQDPADRRLVRAELTPAGRARQHAGAERLHRLQATFAAAHTAADREALERLRQAAAAMGFTKEIV
jgi:DNA-binding MarR family transcriptional regulator